MNAAPVIGIIGLSGSGKSHLAKSIVRAHPNILRMTAGRLLKRTLHTTGEKLRTTESDNVRNNQYELVKALANERAGQLERPVLLEAHAFIDNDSELIDVPADVMASLGLAGIILVDAPATAVLRRRLLDSRKRPRRTLAELRSQRRHLRELGETYKSALDIPLLRIDSGNRARAIAFVDAVITHWNSPGLEANEALESNGSEPEMTAFGVPRQGY